jgi:hypothetical protein
VTAHFRDARTAALVPAFAPILVLLVSLLAAAPGPARAQAPTWVPRDSASFEIYQGDVLLGTEEYRVFLATDTLITGSTLRLAGAGPESRLPLEKRTTFLRRQLDSYPLVFQVIDIPRDTLGGKRATAINCVFTDTTAVIYREITGVIGRGEAIGLPPGRLYILEPGIYAQVQTLAGDFLATKQKKRRQPVLIPSAQQVIELTLTRGPVERLGQEGHVVTTTRVDITDKLTQIVAWIDADGRMWKMEAPGQGLSVERVLPPTPVKAPAPARKGGAKKG